MIKKTIYGLLILLMLFIILIAGINLWPTTNHITYGKFENIIVFGDSLSDSAPMGHQAENFSGNNYWVEPQGVNTPHGAPITSEISPENHHRFTWQNYLIQGYEFTSGKNKLAIKRTLDQVDAYDQNVSYAVASAETGNDYTNDKSPSPWPIVADSDCYNGIHDYGDYSCVPGLRKQVAMYLEDVNDTPNAATLFILWAGGNDFYQNIVKISSDSKAPLSHPISNIVKAVKLLIKKGVPPENIYVFNLPNFSMVPAITTLVHNGVSGSFKQWSALTAISIVSRAYNIWLKSELVIATLGRFSPSNVLLVDDLFLDIYNNENNAYEILNITHPVATTCTDDGDLPYCRGFLFYNDMHPVTSIHHYLSEVIKNKIGG